MSLKKYVGHVSKGRQRQINTVQRQRDRLKASLPRPRTPQTKPAKGREKEQVRNAAGGFVFRDDIETRLAKFLILGCEGGTYYTSERKLTRENAAAIVEAVEQIGAERVVSIIREVSYGGRAPKNDAAIFALAIVASTAGGAAPEKARRAALDAMPFVCRIGTHRLQFAAACDELRGWGPTLRRAFKTHYEKTQPDRLAFDFLKYKERDGWSQRDIIRLSHPKPRTPAHKALFKYIVKGEAPKRWQGSVRRYLDVIIGYEEAKNCDVKRLKQLIGMHGLTREMIPTEFLAEPDVWEALLWKMPPHAMLRNLGNMTKIGLLEPHSDGTKVVVKKIQDHETLRAKRVHPMAIFLAMKVYASGHGVKGHSTWKPVSSIVGALEEAFYKSFSFVTPTNRDICVAVDCSGSMESQMVGGWFSAVEGAAALALTWLHTEPFAMVMGFNTMPIPSMTDALYKGMGLERATKVLRAGGGTDLSVPYWSVKDAQDIITLTDNETWAGRGHVFEWLHKYRQNNQKYERITATCVSMTATAGSVMDPLDKDGLQVIGLDANVMNVVRYHMLGWNADMGLVPEEDGV